LVQSQGAYHAIDLLANRTPRQVKTSCGYGPAP